MMKKDPILARLVGPLSETILSQDTARLSEYLRGRHLPALGGDLLPGDIVLRALEQASNFRQLSTILSSLVGRIVDEEVESLGQPDAVLDARRRMALLNSLYLAAGLPADPVLFDALRRLHGPLMKIQNRGDFDIRGDDHLLPALCQALIYQQTDDSFEKIWLGILEQSRPDTPARETYMLQAWRGLLWIPPDAKRAAQGEVINFGRVALGLKILDQSVEGFEHGSQILRSALDILADTYPRSGPFWASRLAPLASEWSEHLKKEAIRQWPPLRARMEALESNGRGSHLAVG